MDLKVILFLIEQKVFARNSKSHSWFRDICDILH